jgi:hypothetical protein
MRRYLALILLAASPLVLAQRIYDIRDEELEDEDKWKELAAKLPAFPKTANAVEVPAGPTTDNRVYIDLDSLGVGQDGVVRYTLIIRAGGGATNITFEGMRCVTQERKTYGFASRRFGAKADEPGQWRPARNAEWLKITRDSSREHYYNLYVDYLCPDRKTSPDKFADVVNRIKRDSKPAGPGAF